MRRIFPLLVLLALVGQMLPVWADPSTTTDGSISKAQPTLTQIYVQTTVPGDSYPQYGALHEPDGGVLYGRNMRGGTLPNGRFGPINQSENANESVVTQYYSIEELLGDYDLKYWSYMYGTSLSDGEHAFLLYLNWNEEGNACPKILQGVYDAKLREMFAYLKTMMCPVYMRIGGEMNCWTVACKPENFIAAYRHIAKLARAYAPNVALIVSPNYGSPWQTDLVDWYPGDEYVDWVGCSLYYNAVASEGSEAFRGTGEVYGDPMLSVQQIINLANLHSKPVFITEGGSANVINGVDYSDFAAERMGKAYACLPMVYPQIKVICSSDYNYSGSTSEYMFWDDPKITNSIRTAVSDLGIYRSDWKGSGQYMTPLSDYPDLSTATTGDIHLCAYTYTSSPSVATWTLDGQTLGFSSRWPYSIRVNRSQMLSGNHTLRVSFSNGEYISYRIHNGQVGGLQDAPSEWAADEVSLASMMCLVPEELCSNYTGVCTRADFAALAFQTYYAWTGKDVKATKTFRDTSDPNIQKIATLGIMDGTGNGKFSPKGEITREQAAKALANMAKVMGKTMPQKTLDFTDARSISSWAREAVSRAYGAGIMEGGQGKLFLPTAIYTREQSIVSMVRLCDWLGS